MPRSHFSHRLFHSNQSIRARAAPAIHVAFKGLPRREYPEIAAIIRAIGRTSCGE